jgi:cell division transport system permease protein
MTFLRVFKFALQDFWRNIWLSLVTMTVLILALLSVNVLIALDAISNSVIDSVEDKLDINVLLTQQSTKAEIDNFQAYLKNLPEVDSLTYLTKEQVLENFKQKHLDNPDIQDAVKELEGNPFNDTFIIKAKDSALYNKIIQTILNSEYEKIIEVKDFSDPQKIISEVQAMTAKAEQVGLVLTLIFAAIALLIVFNTVRVIIYTHREEIGVMRLVGATNWFIRTPFLLEAVLYTVISLAVKAALLYGLLYFAQPHLATFLQSDFNIVNYYNQNFIRIFGLEFLVAAGLTIISSRIAIAKYLKV